MSASCIGMRRSEIDEWLKGLAVKGGAAASAGCATPPSYKSGCTV